MTYQFTLTKRFICLFIGLALAGLGVALSTRPLLGTSPISSVPYVLTYVWHLSFGMWTIIANLFLLIAQIFILGKAFQWRQLSQLLAVTLFGFFIDCGMWLTQFYIPDHYLARIVEQLLGCAILAFGIGLELIAALAYLPGEGFVKALVQRYKWEFGTVKICFDISLVLIAVTISLIGCGELNGIREGTLLAAIMVGLFIRLFRRSFRGLKLALMRL